MEDIAAGLAIGLCSAALFYLQARASLRPAPAEEQQRHSGEAAVNVEPFELE